jgi:hypothetical protein
MGRVKKVDLLEPGVLTSCAYSFTAPGALPLRSPLLLLLRLPSGEDAAQPARIFRTKNLSFMAPVDLLAQCY